MASTTAVIVNITSTASRPCSIACDGCGTILRAASVEALRELVEQEGWSVAPLADLNRLDLCGLCQ